MQEDTLESPSTSNFWRADATIDELTLALVNFSRVSSPEPLTLLSCCCEKEGCKNWKSWKELKSLLENRLVLSAEVGQALLQRHEAYIRTHKSLQLQLQPARGEGVIECRDASELVKEKAVLEKRLNQALTNNEVTEASNNTILLKLEDARSTISRLNVQQARSAGWETRLVAAIQEREDIQQERDCEANRAKVAESRLKVARDKAAKLQNEVRRLQDALAERSSQHLESSEHILRDTRSRIEALHNSLGKIQNDEQREVMSILEFLVNDNEMLKHDNEELQIMLADSREEIRMLQEENEENRISVPRSRASTPFIKERLLAGSVPSSFGGNTSMHFFHSRSASAEREQSCQGPPDFLTFELDQRPSSLIEFLPKLENKRSFARQLHIPSSTSEFPTDLDKTFVCHNEDFLSSHPPGIHRTPVFSMQSRGTQTDPSVNDALTTGYPFYPFAISSKGPHSESSSFSESSPSNLTTVLERVQALFHRLVQADALTLRNRLKRQNLKGADVGHLSRSTVKNIMYDWISLQSQFRHLLEDDSLVTPCVRKDFRLLFRILKDVLHEFGELRVVLNDVILEPAVATKVSEVALRPADRCSQGAESIRSSNHSAPTSWMTPISKLFSASVQPTGGTVGFNRPVNSRAPRIVPKLEPALSESAMTVNVEFSGTAIGHSTTSTITQQTRVEKCSKDLPVSDSQNPAPAVKDIFVGASSSSSPDPWVVVPRVPRRAQSFVQIGNVDTISRGGPSPVSRHVDAMLDLPSPTHRNREIGSDELNTLPDPIIRYRGLSYSSICSTFTKQVSGESQPTIVVNAPSSTDDGSLSLLPETHSVLQTFSKTMQNFRMTTSGMRAPEASHTAPKNDTGITQEDPPLRPSGRPAKSKIVQPNGPEDSPAGLRSLLTLTNWAGGGSFLKPTGVEDGLLAGSLRDESFMPRRRHPMTDPHREDIF